MEISCGNYLVYKKYTCTHIYLKNNVSGMDLTCLLMQEWGKTCMYSKAYTESLTI
jgi:hypothetical protein